MVQSGWWITKVDEIEVETEAEFLAAIEQVVATARRGGEPSAVPDDGLIEGGETATTDDGVEVKTILPPLLPSFDDGVDVKSSSFSDPAAAAEEGGTAVVAGTLESAAGGEAAEAASSPTTTYRITF